MPAAGPVFLAERLVWKFRLRVLVNGLEVGVSGRGVDVEVDLFDVFGVITLRIREAEQPFLEVRVLAVPERQCEAQTALTVGNTEQPILTPAVGASQRVLVRKTLPQAAIRGVVFTDGRPLTLAQIWAPALPVPDTLGILIEPTCFGICHGSLSAECPLRVTALRSAVSRTPGSS